MRPRPTEIDELLAQEHHWLNGEEGCYFLREYTSGAGYEHGGTNDVISNLKKPPSRRGRPEWRFKERAIRQVAGELVDALDAGWLEGVCLVPMPPSKTPDHPEYDDRMVRVVERVQGLHGGGLDVRFLLKQTESVKPASHGGGRLGPDQLVEVLEVDEGCAEPAPERVVVVDDVVATGAHFVAARRVLRERFGELAVVGVFVARRVFLAEAGAIE